MVSTAKSFPFIARESAATVGGTVATNTSIMDEHFFVLMLRIERKRTERSGKPFMLMLLDGGELFQDPAVLRDIATAIGASTRETDTLGWYETGSMLGVLFTELGTTERLAIQRIGEKVFNSLREHLDEDAARRLTVTLHLYPEDIGARNEHSLDTRLYPDLERMAERKKASQTVKRTIDILGSTLAILMLLPVFLLVAAAVKLTSKGPLLFRQTRIGQYGKPFTFLKFRSMEVDNDTQIHEEFVKKLIASGNHAKQPEAKSGTFKLTNDPRVTPIGRVIRRTSLDELPQFFNVLRGEMSLVGPRPPVRYEYEVYDVWHRHRVNVKPGITGLWQVNGRSKTTFNEMVRLDLQYAESWSIPMDLMILVKTPKAVLSCSGAY